VKEANDRRLFSIKVTRQDWITLEFTKAIKVELSREGCKVGMFEVLWENILT
jgi:hypothetical protein